MKIFIALIAKSYLFNEIKHLIYIFSVLPHIYSLF